MTRAHQADEQTGSRRERERELIPPVVGHSCNAHALDRDCIRGFQRNLVESTLAAQTRGPS